MEGKVLVVDDDDATRRSLAEILRLEGCLVKTAANGLAALELLREDEFDVILLDLKMPGLDGLDVLRQAQVMAPDTKTILLTAHGSMESAIEALRHGAHDYLLKPSSPVQIMHSVQAALDRRFEAQRKRVLLNQLDASLQELRNVEKPAPLTRTGAPLAAASSDTAMETGMFRFGNGVVVDFFRREVRWEEYMVLLTPAETKLLKILCDAPGRVFSHRELAQSVQGYEIEEWEAPEGLRPLVSRLRRKLAAIPGGPQWIANVRGAGYTFEIPHPDRHDPKVD